ncbi:hypothetical protein RhiirA1_401883 [Rhizophagus irregularis]|uniref:Uncharacterized protein n=2 Tax=Rhizophagus irregularis TaxID=588596 RepID=A0A2N0R0F7_9GLOM|nr:hypothetical protein GLOIN_2v1476158 [Rhizophagus irregularis DAOM 181602=DAOM 197198]PKC56787.1 hypothetical protein RhiirA1_401883 [Rhizophagus irregularis]POG74457.1 hypothetical protein GLOIN_2v1476158 [Rhizophagus irregularis DAOM 181602=DAOM 197198]|eukprot:XP_025181323.1 hypothetical protein GLOIN_2v1476158 [Rhizophagus irregularis DAOM 181602=DAOM 197198]
MKVNKFVNDLRGQTKAKLFEVPKKPLPTYFHEYQNMLLLKIHVCQEIIESNESCCHLKLELLEGEQSKIKDDIHQSNSSGNEVLDFDGCVTKGSRYNGNASKNFSTVRLVAK